MFAVVTNSWSMFGRVSPVLMNLRFREGLSGTDEHFGTPSGYEIGDRVMVSGCGSICIPINVSSSTDLEIHR